MQKISVVGLGYIGLPTAVLLAEAGFGVSGFDIDAVRIDKLSSGICPIHELELPERLQSVIRAGNISFSSDLADSDVFIICLPTPVYSDHKADLSFVEDGARRIASVLKKGDLVILESTVPPGTTDLLLEETIFSISGLSSKGDYFLAHAPERVIPGAIFDELINNPRVIGGASMDAAIAAKEIYEKMGVKKIILTNSKTAELSKVVENTFRDVNIAFANELDMVSRAYGVNVHELISIANMHPRVNIHTPGIGVGGHCISVDPWFIVEHCPKIANLIKMARTINDSRPGIVVSDIINKHGKLNMSPIGLLGVTYKPNIDDIRESPALEVIELLERMDRRIKIFDPYCSIKNNSTLDEIKVLDTVAVLVDHSCFSGLVGENVIRWNR